MWRSVLTILDARQRLGLVLVLLSSLLNVFSELFSLGFVFMLSRIVLAPAYNGSKFMRGVLGDRVSSPASLLPYLAAAVIAAYFLKLCLGVGTARLRAGYIQQQQIIFSERLLRRYLAKGWSFFLKKNATVLTDHVINHCAMLATCVLSEFVVLANELCVIVAICVALCFISPTAALAIAALLLLIAALFHRAAGPWFQAASIRSHTARAQYATIADAILRGAKEVILYDRPEYFLRRLRHTMEAQAHIETTALTVREVPRYVFEFSAVTALMGAVAAQVLMRKPIELVAATTAVFTVASFRLIASASRATSAMATINGFRAVVAELQPDLSVIGSGGPAIADESRGIDYQHCVELRHVSYQYDGAIRRSVDDVSVAFSHGESIGVVGATGAGKSTLIELLLGVLPAQSGEIVVDGQRLTADRRRAWQTKVGYVPQDPFLIDDTVARNIAFGIADADIDPQRLREAAHAACIQEFIEEELPHGYDTLIGDRGMSLSGGQQQRLAIARAVYRRPQLIVLDEATSALDNVTEAIVSDAIANLSHKMTVIIVAHRLSTVQKCDRIVVLDQGRVIQCGTLEQLSKEPGAFKRQMDVGQLGIRP